MVKKPVQILKRLALMQRQLGNLSGSILFYVRGVDGWAKEVNQKAYLEAIKVDLADMTKQCHVLCEDLEFIKSDVEKIGDQRYNELYEKFVKEGRTAEWV